MSKETQIPPKMIRKINRWISPMPMDRETKKLMRMAAYYAYKLAVEYEQSNLVALRAELQVYKDAEAKMAKDIEEFETMTASEYMAKDKPTLS